MDGWSAVNSEYELTEWEREDPYWIRESPGGYRSRFTIDREKAEELMRLKLIGHGVGLDADTREKILKRIKELGDCWNE